METQVNGTVHEQSYGGARTFAGSSGTQPKKVAYAITERSGKSFWTRVGAGFINRDGSITIRLDAIPVSGTLQLRDWTPRDAGERQEPSDGRGHDPFAAPPSFGKLSDVPF